MSFAKKHNQVTAQFNYELTDDHQYMSLSDLVQNYGVENEYPVRMIYLNKKGKFGTAPVIVTDHFLVNAPAHLNETVKEILTDAESVNLINKGYVGFKVYQYTNQYGEQFSVEWVDIEPTEAEETEEPPKKKK